MAYTFNKCSKCGQTYYEGDRHVCPPPPVVTAVAPAQSMPIYPQKIQNRNPGDTIIGLVFLAIYAMAYLGIFRDILDSEAALTGFAVLTISFINALIGAAIGSIKKQTGTGFAAAAVLPVIGWIIMAVVPKRDEYLCPICHSGVDRLASKCPRCQSFIS